MLFSRKKLILPIHVILGGERERQKDRLGMATVVTILSIYRMGFLRSYRIIFFITVEVEDKRKIKAQMLPINRHVNGRERA